MPLELLWVNFAVSKMRELGFNCTAECIEKMVTERDVLRGRVAELEQELALRNEELDSIDSQLCKSPSSRPPPIDFPPDAPVPFVLNELVLTDG